MRISDWSSDVCFSDLGGQAVEVPARAGGRPRRARVRGSDPDRLLPADIFEQLQRQPEGRGREAEAARRHVPGRSECGGAEDRRPRPIDLTRLRAPAPGQGARQATPGGKGMQRSGCLLFAMTFLAGAGRSEEHTSELQSLMRISYAVFCLKKKKKKSR